MTDDAALGRARRIIDEGEWRTTRRERCVARHTSPVVSSSTSRLVVGRAKERSGARKSGGGLNVDDDGDDDGDETRGEGDARG